MPGTRPCRNAGPGQAGRPAEHQRQHPKRAGLGLCGVGVGIPLPGALERVTKAQSFVVHGTQAGHVLVIVTSGQQSRRYTTLTGAMGSAIPRLGSSESSTRYRGKRAKGVRDEG
jgi:hypothetical protein